MTAPEPRLLRRAAQAALAVHRLGMTRAFSLDQPFAIRLASEDAVWYAGVYGPLDDGEGAHFANGPLGLRRLRDLADRRKPDAACENEVERLDVAYVTLHALAPAKRAALQRAGVLLSAGDAAPDFSVTRRNRSSPDKRDLRLLEVLLLALLRAGEQEPGHPASGEIPTVTVHTEGEGRLGLTWELHADDLGRTKAPVRCSDATEAWPVLDRRWVLGIGEMPPIGETGGPRRLLFIVDADDGKTITLSGASRGDTTSLARDFLRGVWIDELEPGFAREMTVLDEELRPLLEAALGPRGVRVLAASSHPAMDAAQERLRRRVANFDAEDDLESWRVLAQALDAAVGRRAFEGTDVREAWRVFLGPWHPDVEDGDDETVIEQVVTTLTEWAAFSWRRHPRSPTAVERILRGELDSRSRAFLAAHAAASPSLYVVRRTDPAAETLDLEDVFTGERVTTHDRSLSNSAVPDLVVPLRVVPVGPFRMLWMAGPHFRAHQLPEVLARIEDQGVPATAEGIAERPEVLGRLWPWAWEHRKHPALPRATNADQDDIVFHEAVYELTDGNAARAALSKRPDLDYGGAEDRFTWTRPTRGDEAAWGTNIVLGNLRFLGDELIAEVNSEPRYRALRTWLDQVPGVVFRKVKTADMAAIRSRQRPKDDLLPDAEPTVVPPEATAALFEHLDEHWRTWPDIPVPMYGGKTPREACATPEGRAGVAAFIRTLTSPHPSYDVAAVRERLLRDLGL